MSKKIIISVGAGLVLLGWSMVSVVGCGGNGNNGGGGAGGTGAGGGSVDMAGGGGAGGGDMAFVCVQNPMADPDFLNACAPANVDSVLIDPFYPQLAPNGALPALP